MWYNIRELFKKEEYPMSGTYGLKINEEVLSKMATLAASEIEGVRCISAKATNIKGVVARGGFGKSVKAKVGANGEVTINVFISVQKNAKVKDIAQQVQANVKEKVQNMTGSAVSHVNVHIADVEPEEEEESAE
jgi:uncharacterized alkaline shock family protein YloU